MLNVLAETNEYHAEMQLSNHANVIYFLKKESAHSEIERKM